MYDDEVPEFSRTVQRRPDSVDNGFWSHGTTPYLCQLTTHISQN